MRNKPLIGAVFAAALSGLIGLEGMKLTAYRDIVGIPTICAGTTAGVKMGDTKTAAQCWTIAEHEYRKFEKVVIDNVKVPLTTNQQIALTYFCLNVGEYGCKTSTALRQINAGNYTAGCQAMAMWNKVTVNGVKAVSKGLVNRRAAEVKRCLAP